MNISGIRTHAGFYDYNTIKNNELGSRQVQEAKETEEVLAPQEEMVKTLLKNRKPDLGALAYAKQYQPDVSHELKGMRSDVEHLDVEKAISDMKKDQVLQQYQFFVGESKAGDALSVQRENENFSL